MSENESRLERNLRLLELNETVAKRLCKRRVLEGEEFKRPEWHKYVYGGYKR